MGLSSVTLPRPRGVNRWGPFVRSLTVLRRETTPLPLRTVLCADFSRLVRNKITHKGLSILTSLGDSEIERWKSDLRQQARASGWPELDVISEVDYAAHQVVGQAVIHVKAARETQGKNLPFELFYMLFNFTNLDSLAFSVEEA